MVNGQWSIVNGQLLKNAEGYGKDIEPREMVPDDSGNITIEIKELERVSIKFEAAGTYRGLAPPSTWNGYHVIGSRLKPLPIGSTLDMARGIFYWQPGPGFLGRFHLLFVASTQHGEMKRKRIVINIVPQISHR
jgi:hypothetical protein